MRKSVKILHISHIYANVKVPFPKKIAKNEA